MTAALTDEPAGRRHDGAATGDDNDDGGDSRRC